MSVSPKTMVIILRGTAMPVSDYASLSEIVSSCSENPAILIPKIPLGVFSYANPNKIVANLLSEIDKKWKSFDENTQETLKIIIIGHSTGALLARKLYLSACGENIDAPIEPEIDASSPRVWSYKVERLILFAGINKGWSLTPHMGILETIKLKTAIGIGNLMKLCGFEPLAFQTRRGHPFITQLRIQSLSMYKHAAQKNNGNALIIQLLGTQDTLVSPEDNIDLLTDQEFIYLEIPFSDHKNVVKMTGENGDKRADVTRKALTLTRQELQDLETIPSDQWITPRDSEVTDVVFVIHGIRDTGYWTQKIARRVKSMGDKLPNRKFAIETSTYGYFPIGSFFMSQARQVKVQWFMDQYVENLALYPNAEFSFIGHSNGTYLLSKALADYPAIKFKNIVLAGSVVRNSYNWSALITEKRVGSVFNFVATNDYVVAVFPKTLQTFGIQDLGSGGYDGFRALSEDTQFKCIPGGHDAAIREITWDELANIAIVKP